METSVCCHRKQIYLEKQNISYLKTSHFGNAASGIKSFKGLNTVTEKSQKFSRASAFSRILIWKISEIASVKNSIEIVMVRKGENNMVKTLA